MLEKEVCSSGWGAGETEEVKRFVAERDGLLEVASEEKAYD